MLTSSFFDTVVGQWTGIDCHVKKFPLEHSRKVLLREPFQGSNLT